MGMANHRPLLFGAWAAFFLLITDFFRFSLHHISQIYRIFQYFAYSITDNTLTLSYYLDQGVSVNTTPGKTVDVLPGNDICIYYKSGNVYSRHRTFELSDTSMTI